MGKETKKLEDIFVKQFNVTRIKSSFDDGTWTTEGKSTVGRTQDGEVWESISAEVKIMDRDFVNTIQTVGKNLAEQLYEKDALGMYEPIDEEEVKRLES